jgi:hypothetical protein
MLYERGKDWVMVHDTPIPYARLMVSYMRAAGDYKWERRVQVAPIDLLRKEIEKRGWDKHVDVSTLNWGTRCVRFYAVESEGADCPTGAYILPHGVIEFTRNGNLKKWDEIFGKGIVDEWTDGRMGVVTEPFWYVVDDSARNFWFIGPSGAIHKETGEGIRSELKFLGLRAAALPTENLSEIDRAIKYIKDYKRCEMSLPLHYEGKTITTFQGQRVWNTSTCKVMEPRKDASTTYGVDFPALAKHIDNLFTSPDVQKDAFLDTLAHRYQAAYYHRMGETRFQAITVCGPASAGKGHFRGAVLEPIFGKGADAGTYITATDQFNGNLFNAPLWYMEDEEHMAEPGKTERRVKRLVANDRGGMRGMRKEMVEVPQRMLIWMSLNNDPISLSGLLRVYESVDDKFSLFLVQTPHTPAEKATYFRDLTAKLQDELPAFCQYLLHRVISRPDPRYGCLAYQHPVLVEAGKDLSRAATFGSIFESWREARMGAGGLEYEVMTTEKIAAFMINDAEIGGLMKAAKLDNPVAVGREMAQLERAGDKTMRNAFIRRAYGRYWLITRSNTTCDEQIAKHGEAKLKASAHA